MRAELQKRDGLRGRFTARFARFGKKTAYKGPPIQTALFVNVRDEADEEVTDHLWMTVGKQLADLDLQPGNEVEFEARVTSYEKGYRGRRDDVDLPPVSKDYRLSYPTNVRKRNEASAVTLPLFEQTAS